MLQLIGSPLSPFVRKVRMVMAEKRIDYEFMVEDVLAADSRIHVLNPLGKVPALIVDEDQILYDSRVIVEYLDASSPVQRLIPPDGRERLDVRRWEALADGITDAAVLLRYEQVFRTPDQRSLAWTDRQWLKVRLGVADMERQLALRTQSGQGLQGKSWCCGAKLSLADIAVACTLGYLDFRLAQDYDWRAVSPHLSQFLEHVASRPSFVETRPPQA